MQALLERAAEAPKVSAEEDAMGINSESDVAANLRIGPTTLGMVRLFVESEGLELPLDFDPDEAEEIAGELLAAAARAREMGGPQKGAGTPGSAQAGGKRRRGSGSSR
jgi:hypothetical protein